LTALWAGVAAVAAAVAAAGGAAVLIRRPPDRLLVINRRGRPIPAVLGWAFTAGVAVGWVLVVLWGGLPTGVLGLEVVGGLGLVAAAGFLDDLAGHRARGFRGHLASLARGRMTTGILKLVVGVAAGVTLAVAAGGGIVRVVASAVLIVVSVNLWNALDVAPGRALKWGLAALGVVLLTALSRPAGALAGAGFGAAVAVLPFDLGERGMLGDAGSNPLGLVAGLGLAAVLPTWGVILAAAAALVLQVAAETVTISRLIEATPPLRWVDGLGRKP
jgi:UDP-GlcNAc:undecaprenyl-phosphate GlcNAc-1-phosphate transferase